MIDQKDQSIMIQVKREGTSYRLHKPVVPTALDSFYTIAEDGLTVCVRWTPQGPSKPAVLYFASDDEDQFFTAVGFAKAGQPVPECTTRGSCGECFSLYEDISGKERVLAVANGGDQLPGGYDFSLWLNRKQFDPQIYNQGELDTPACRGSNASFRGLLRRLKRLRRRLKSWFR